jgi:hypothetical protein
MAEKNGAGHRDGYPALAPTGDAGLTWNPLRGSYSELIGFALQVFRLLPLDMDWWRSSVQNMRGSL